MAKLPSLHAISENQGKYLVFWEKIQKMYLSPKYGRKTKWYHQKVHLKSFPMNGHVSSFRQS
jgi:hypothetical protein